MRHEGKLAFLETRTAMSNRILFHCPGCGCNHYADYRWTYNGDPYRPTFTPSIHVHNDDGSTMCHSFVRDGMIQFLDDCQHELRGQTVELPEWES